MPFGSASPIAPNGALFAAGFRTASLLAEAANPNRGLPSSFGAVSMIRPGSGEIIYFNNPTVNNGADITVAGPVANGRDQVAAFPNNSLVHFYSISTGGSTFIDTIASLTPPFATPGFGVQQVNRNISTLLLGPTLPDGYLYWAYVGCIPMNGAALHFGQYEKNWFHFQTPQNLVNSAAVNANFGLLTGLRNYGTEAIKLNMRASLTTNGLGAASSDLQFVNQAGFSVGSGSTFIMPVSVPVATGTIEDSAQVDCPFHGFAAMGGNDFSFNWINDVNPANIAARNFTADIAAFRCGFSLKD